jgi:hypothetical protein
MVGHVRLYEAWLMGVLEPARREAQPPYRSYLTGPAELEERNRLSVEHERTLDPDRSWAAARATHEALREVLARLPDDQLALSHTVVDGRFVPAADGRPLVSLVAFETWWHYRDHALQLEAVAAAT